jgi:hypothetical protein
MDQSKDELMADIIRYMKTSNAPEKAQTQYKKRIKSAQQFPRQRKQIVVQIAGENQGADSILDTKAHEEGAECGGARVH